MTTVLLVEDDPAIAGPLTRALARETYDVRAHDHGRSALEDLDGIDLVVLDLGLPDMDGLDVAREIRSSGSAVPILILTARAAEVDGALAHDEADGDLVVQDVRIDVAAHRAYVSGVELSLTAKEFELLRVLVREAGNVVPRDTLMREVWGNGLSGSTKTLDMHVSWLRRKLGDDAASPRYITTVRGMGFRFEKPSA